MPHNCAPTAIRYRTKTLDGQRRLQAPGPRAPSDALESLFSTSRAALEPGSTAMPPYLDRATAEYMLYGEGATARNAFLHQLAEAHRPEQGHAAHGRQLYEDGNWRIPVGRSLDTLEDPISTVSQDSTWWNSDDNVEIFEMGFPYLPFFSNCVGYDSHMSIAKLMEEHPDCERPDIKSTIFLNQYPWGGQLTPFADTCVNKNWQPTSWDANAGKGAPGIPIGCFYEEVLLSPTPGKRWFEFATGDVLFTIPKEPIKYSDFRATEDGVFRWGRTPAISSVVGTEQSIDVLVLSGSAET